MMLTLMALGAPDCLDRCQSFWSGLPFLLAIVVIVLLPVLIERLAARRRR